METRERIYDTLLDAHLAEYRQMAFVSGPRQVGKTTTCRRHVDGYVNWDNLDDREQILAGPTRLAERFGLNRLSESPPVVLFDELHKHPRWKVLLKGFFDTYADQVRILVTGSSRMDTYRRGGDSLMGRYFLYRMHPFSVAETLNRNMPDPGRIVRAPAEIPDQDYHALWDHGGYPEPFLMRDHRFSRRWQSLRWQQLVREEIRGLAQINQIDQLEMLAKILTDRSAQPLVYSNLAQDIQVSVDTVRRWIDILSSLHLGFRLRPWFRNVTRSLRKEPRWYLRDWSGIEDPGRRAETFIGCHLLKAVEGWTDMGLGTFELAYLRDKRKREVDFVVIREGKPWFLVEVKHSDETLGASLAYFQTQLKAPFAFQVVVEADYVDANCFTPRDGPLVVPARTFLSQLL
ncbi:ATP-binding protein [Gemmatimonadota bacterium]